MAALCPHRRDGLAVEALGSELLVYDVEADAVHQLDAVQALVYQSVDGRRSVPELSLATQLSQGQVTEALDALVAAGLVEVPPT